MTMTGVLNLDYVTEYFCYVQENVTFLLVLLGFMYPALLSLVGLDMVTRHGRTFFTLPITLFSSVVVLGIGMTVALTPLFAIKQTGVAVHEHGCHMWSTRIDPVVWYQVYGIGACLAVCVFIMGICYLQLYLTAKKSVAQVNGHKAQLGELTTAASDQVPAGPSKKKRNFDVSRQSIPSKGEVTMDIPVTGDATSTATRPISLSKRGTCN
jgi:hypothetical protein